MRAEIIKKRGIVLFSSIFMMASVIAVNPAYADTVNEEDLISDVNVPENGIIQYDVTVPAGSTVNYKVELTPDKKTGTIDKVEGMWKNTTKETITKTINAKVKFLSSEYTISATYTSNSTHQELAYKDQEKAVKSYDEKTTHGKVTLDFRTMDSWKNTLDSHVKNFISYFR